MITTFPKLSLFVNIRRVRPPNVFGKSSPLLGIRDGVKVQTLIETIRGRLRSYAGIAVIVKIS